MIIDWNEFMLSRIFMDFEFRCAVSFLKAETGKNVLSSWESRDYLTRFNLGDFYFSWSDVLRYRAKFWFTYKGTLRGNIYVASRNWGQTLGIFFSKGNNVSQNWFSLLYYIHAKNGIWIITGGIQKITVCFSTFYGVNSNFYGVGSKNYCSHRKMYWSTP